MIFDKPKRRALVEAKPRTKPIAPTQDPLVSTSRDSEALREKEEKGRPRHGADGKAT